MSNGEMQAGIPSDVVGAFLRRWNALPNKQRYQLVPELPIPEMQRAALTHPNPWLRRGCVSFLDHYANDESIHVFLGALDDPVPFVREIALHGLSCERCRTAELCVADVVPVLSRVLATDESPAVRHKVVPILMHLSNRSSPAREALRRSSLADDDILVRQAATAALEGRERDACRSRHDLRRRAKTRRGKAVAPTGQRLGPIRFPGQPGRQFDVLLEAAARIASATSGGGRRPSMIIAPRRR
jgi:HEAT repeat protein